MSLNDYGNRVLDFFYPPRCIVCGEIRSAEDSVCPGCAGRLPYIRGNRCRKCGKPVEDGQEFCVGCEEKKHLFREGYGVFLYDDVMRQIISAFKYENRPEYAKTLADLVFQEAGDILGRWNPDALVPVPLHRERFLKRGYNQAELIAEHLSKLSGIPMKAGLLKRSGNTGALKQLSAKARSEETKHAFRLNGKTDGIRRVVLIDDIYTTGSTVDAAAAPLIEGGIEEVFFLAVCIGAGFMVEW